MIPLYTNIQFVEAKSRDLLPIKCEYCEKLFLRPKNDIQWALKRNGVNCLKLCSIKCRNLSNDKKIECKCKHCNKKIRRQRHFIKKNKYQFCSISCSTLYWNTHKTWGSTRSKLELWIEEQLRIRYPNLNIHFNHINTIGAQLDNYIPLLKIAFEINGIFHYEPVFGENKLNRTKFIDQQKIQKCIEKGISLRIIDTHTTKYFKPKRDKKFLQIIIDDIDNKSWRQE